MLRPPLKLRSMADGLNDDRVIAELLRSKPVYPFLDKNFVNVTEEQSIQSCPG